MTFKKRPMSADGSSVERRKSQRFPVVVPIEVSWQQADGTEVKEDAIARQVNAKGGFLKMSTYPDLGKRVTLTNFLSARTADARVIAAPHAREGVANGIIVELIVPNESFWGVDLQVKKTIVELETLEKALRCEDMDIRLVKEYRDSVDHIRKAAETLQQLRELQFREMDHSELLGNLATDRIRRTITLCNDVVVDLEAGRVKHSSQEVQDLSRALEQAQDYLKQHGGIPTTTRDARQQKLSVAIPISRTS